MDEFLLPRLHLDPEGFLLAAARALGAFVASHATDAGRAAQRALLDPVTLHAHEDAHREPGAIVVQACNRLSSRISGNAFHPIFEPITRCFGQPQEQDFARIRHRLLACGGPTDDPEHEPEPSVLCWSRDEVMRLPEGVECALEIHGGFVWGDIAAELAKVYGPESVLRTGKAPVVAGVAEGIEEAWAAHLPGAKDELFALLDNICATALFITLSQGAQNVVREGGELRAILGSIHCPGAWDANHAVPDGGVPFATGVAVKIEDRSAG